MSVFNSNYKEILDSAEQIRKSILEKNIDYISFGGVMPETDTKEIAAVVKIEKAVFDYLITEGLEFREIQDRPNLLETTFEGTRYICQKNYTPVETTNIPITNVNKTDVETKKEATPEEKFTIFYNGTIMEDEELEEDQIEITSNLRKDLSNVQTLTYILNDGTSSKIQHGTNIINLYYKDEIVAQCEFEAEEPFTQETQNKATYIGSDNIIDYSNLNVVPPEEKRTPISDLVYEKIEISLQHPGFNTDPEIYEILVAPLKLYKQAISTVPIIVVIWKKGFQSRTISSSYDSYETGKNLVTMNIDDYNILVRGTFTSEGEFNSIITTTEHSANQGDILEVKSKTSFGKDSSHRSVNGHPVLPYSSDEGHAFLFVLPLGETGDDIFLVASKTDEFCEYQISSSDSYGANRAFVYTTMGELTIIPHWDGDYLEIDTFEE